MSDPSALGTAVSPFVKALYQNCCYIFRTADRQSFSSVPESYAYYILLLAVYRRHNIFAAPPRLPSHTLPAAWPLPTARPLPSTMASSDRASLVALFRATGGTGWKRSDNWNTDADLSKWYGVKVNEHGRVVKLDLNRNNLQGM